MAMGSQVSTGAKLELNIGGVAVAYASHCNYTLNYNHQPIEVFNETTVNEYAELGITVEFSAAYFRVAKQAAFSLGLMPTIADFLSQPTLVMFIKDSVSGAKLVKVKGVKCISRAGSVDARGIFSETLNFVGTYFTDESD
jgi:hypothetical protein